MKRWLIAAVAVPGVMGLAAIGAGCGAKREPESRPAVDPEQFRVRTNCIRFVKWHHLANGKVSHFGYALTRSPDERAVFRSFGMRDGEMTFQIDGYLEPETLAAIAADTGGDAIRSETRRLRSVDYRRERLIGSEITPGNIRELIGKETFVPTRSEVMTRRHTVYEFCGFTDEEMDRMEARERNMKEEVEKFRAEKGKRFDAFNCTVSGAIVGCEGGATGLLKPWRLPFALNDEFLREYSSFQTALMDRTMIEAVEIGRGRIIGELERKED